VFEPIDRGINQGDWSTLDWVALGRFGLALVVPGMALMFVLWIWVRALFRRAGTGGILLSIGARDPRPRDLEEQQVVNVLQEMAIAAGLPPPALKILDQPEPNLAAVGRDPAHATIVVTCGLPHLSRDEPGGTRPRIVDLQRRPGSPCPLVGQPRPRLLYTIPTAGWANPPGPGGGHGARFERAGHRPSGRIAAREPAVEMP
jgi:hypothetical protein